MGVETKGITQTQREELVEKSAQAFRMISDLAIYTGKVDVNIIGAIISVNVRGKENPELVFLGNPQLSRGSLLEVLRFLGDGRELFATQSEVVDAYVAHQDGTYKCGDCQVDNCPGRNEPYEPRNNQ